MGKKLNNIFKGPFAGIPLKAIKTQAFKELRANAVKVLLYMSHFYFQNGNIAFSQYDGEIIGLKDKKTTCRALIELQEKGFIEQTSDPIRGRKKTEWRITYFEDMRQGHPRAPTHDYLNYPNIKYKNEFIEARINKTKNRGQNAPMTGDKKPP